MPFARPQRRPFGWWVGAALDQHSRVVLKARVWRRLPSAKSFIALLRDGVARAGAVPKYIVSDRGSQFQREYRDWCEESGIKPRFGAVYRHRSIANIERFWKSLKDEAFRCFPVPLSIHAMRRELTAYLEWYHRHRPHQALGGLTPGKRLEGAMGARDRRRLEPRSRIPLGRDGPPGKRRQRKRVAHLELVVDQRLGSAKLPVPSLRHAA
jgi:transposase InsO family protein